MGQDGFFEGMVVLHTEISSVESSPCDGSSTRDGYVRLGNKHYEICGLK